jgi:hypothetical protein
MQSQRLVFEANPTSSRGRQERKRFRWCVVDAGFFTGGKFEISGFGHQKSDRLSHHSIFMVKDRYSTSNPSPTLDIGHRQSEWLQWHGAQEVHCDARHGRSRFVQRCSEERRYG